MRSRFILFSVISFVVFTKNHVQADQCDSLCAPRRSSGYINIADCKSRNQEYIKCEKDLEANRKKVFVLSPEETAKRAEYLQKQAAKPNTNDNTLGWKKIDEASKSKTQQPADSTSKSSRDIRVDSVLNPVSSQPSFDEASKSSATDGVTLKMDLPKSLKQDSPTTFKDGVKKSGTYMDAEVSKVKLSDKSDLQRKCEREQYQKYTQDKSDGCYSTTAKPGECVFDFKYCVSERTCNRYGGVMVDKKCVSKNDVADSNDPSVLAQTGKCGKNAETTGDKSGGKPCRCTQNQKLVTYKELAQCEPEVAKPEPSEKLDCLEKDYSNESKKSCAVGSYSVKVNSNKQAHISLCESYKDANGQVQTKYSQKVDSVLFGNFVLEQKDSPVLNDALKAAGIGFDAAKLYFLDTTKLENQAKQVESIFDAKDTPENMSALKKLAQTYNQKNKLCEKISSIEQNAKPQPVAESRQLLSVDKIQTLSDRNDDKYYHTVGKCDKETTVSDDVDTKAIEIVYEDGQKDSIYPMEFQQYFDTGSKLYRFKGLSGKNMKDYEIKSDQDKLYVESNGQKKYVKVYETKATSVNQVLPNGWNKSSVCYTFDGQSKGVNPVKQVDRMNQYRRR